MLNITSDWWDWAEATIVNQLRVAAMYNGQPPYGLRGYIGKIYIQILDPKIVAVVNWWSLLEVIYVIKNQNGTKNGGRCRQVEVVVITQV